MMAKRIRTNPYRSATAAHSKVMAARQEMAAAEEEPMRHYPHTIPQARSSGCCPQPEQSQAMTQVLEQLSCQSQLLVDLLGAVNSLTAALLCEKTKT